MSRGHPRETGAALLTVLILVGVMGALAVAVFDRLRLATLLAGNAAGLDAARGFGLVAEALVTTRIDDLVAASPRKTTLAGGWQGRTIALPLPAGRALATVTDGGNCFNLNSLAVGTPPDALVSNPLAIDQFARLLTFIDVPQRSARGIAAAAADWIDSDANANPDGAEDAVYARGATPYRAANTLMAEASELRAVAGVTPALYARLRPWVCALPLAELSPINVNTLASAQAPLVAMLFTGDLTVDAARRVLAERPTGGWDTAAAFLDTPTLKDLRPSTGAAQQIQVRSRWFALDMTIDVAGTSARETALVDARRTPARLVARRWTRDE